MLKRTASLPHSCLALLLDVNPFKFLDEPSVVNKDLTPKDKAKDLSSRTDFEKLSYLTSFMQNETEYSNFNQV